MLGPGAVIAPEHKVVLDTDPDRARATGRAFVSDPYLKLSNYTANLRRYGYTDADLDDGGSDRLIDALVLHGSPDIITAGLRSHLDAGADHVPQSRSSPATATTRYRPTANSLAYCGDLPSKGRSALMPSAGNQGPAWLAKLRCWPRAVVSHPYRPPAAELVTPSAERADKPAATRSCPPHPAGPAPAHPAPWVLAARQINPNLYT